MPSRTLKLTGVVGCLLVLAGLGAWQQSRTGSAAAGDGPIAHWVFDPARLPAPGGPVPNLDGGLPVTLTGAPRFLAEGPTAALEFRGETDGAFVDGEALAKARPLPRAALSVTAWVRVDRGEPPGGLGGLVGLFQNHFDAERGLLLGYDTDRFAFGLAAESAAERGGPMTLLRSQSRFVPGRWYHLAATYDGRRMRLFVNG